MAIERACPNAAHWARLQYEELFGDESNRVVFVAEMGAEIAGFLVARRVAEEYDIENIAVMPAAQRQGLGRALLEHFVNVATHENVGRIFLEVRESNAGARALYEKCYFAEMGRRRGYYTDPVEDAIVYRWAGRGTKRGIEPEQGVC